MSIQYVHITNDVIDAGPRSKPRAWENNSFGITITDEILATFGWYPVTEVKPAFDPSTQKLEFVGTTWEASTETVTSTWQAVPLTQEELEELDDLEDEAAIKTDPTVKALILSRPTQIETYIENNVNNLAQAKSVLTILAKAISAIGKRKFR